MGEFQHHALVLAIAAKPDIALVVDEHAVLVGRPVITLGRLRPAPRLDDVALLVELDHRRRREAAFGLVAPLGALVAVVHGARTLADPDIVVLVDENAADLSEDPILRQWLGPRRVDLEFGRTLRRESRSGHRKSDNSGKRHHATHSCHQSLLCLARHFLDWTVSSPALAQTTANGMA